MPADNSNIQYRATFALLDIKEQANVGVMKSRFSAQSPPESISAITSGDRS